MDRVYAICAKNEKDAKEILLLSEAYDDLNDPGAQDELKELEAETIDLTKPRILYTLDNDQYEEKDI